MSVAALRYPYAVASHVSTGQLSWHERAALAIGVIEIPLQIDKYFMFHKDDSDLGAVGGLNISITTICFAYLYAVWIAKAAVLRNRTSQPNFLFGIPLIVYISMVALSLLSAAVPALAVFDLFLLAQAYAIFFYLANRLKTFDDLAFCLMALAATMIIQSLLIFGLSAMGSAAAGQIYDFGPITLSVWDDGRPAGTVKSAVVVGTLLAILWMPVMALSFCLQRWPGWILTTLATTMGLVAIVLTQTRGAVLTVAVGSILFGWGMYLRGWLPKWAITTALVMVLTSAIPMAMMLQKRVFGDDMGSAESRKHLTLIAMDTIARQPILGYGSGNCHLACEKSANSGRFRSEWYYTIHCKYLVVWIETGLLGLLAFVFMLGNSLRYGLSAWASQHRLLAPLGLACTAAIAGHMLHMLVDIFNSRSQVQLLWTILGVSAAVYQQARTWRSTVTSGPRVGRSYVA